jgi:hypothetical protein
MTEKQQIAIRLMADWGTGPFWVAVDGGPVDGYEVDEITDILSLSDELLQDIAAWDGRLQATYDKETPQESGFVTADEWTRFDDEGRKLVERIKAEAPEGVVVEYGEFSG